MQEPRLFSPAEVAQALGVSENTVKRWVDGGVLPAYKTPGGHRKLLYADVVRLVRERNFPRLDLGRLSAGAAESTPSPATLARRLHMALKKGDGEAVRSLLIGAHRGGMRIEEMGDTVIAPAMHATGHEWETGRIDVFHEHRATQLCVAAVHELKGMLEPHAENNRPVAVGGTPEADPYLLASLLAQMVLLDHGWDAINLGPNTPLGSFLQAATELRPRLLWLSFSHVPDAGAFLEEYAKFYPKVQALGVRVVVGGQALTREMLGRMLYAAHGEGMRHLGEFADTLYQRPKPRPRGRPRRPTQPE